MRRQLHLEYWSPVPPLLPLSTKGWAGLGNTSHSFLLLDFTSFSNILSACLPIQYLWAAALAGHRICYPLCILTLLSHPGEGLALHVSRQTFVSNAPGGAVTHSALRLAKGAVMDMGGLDQGRGGGSYIKAPPAAPSAAYGSVSGSGETTQTEGLVAWAKLGQWGAR